MKLLEQLKAKGIAKVIITFDGSGDSGGIDGVYCCNEDEQEIKASELEEALIELGNTVIERHYVIGFDNEGCFGEITLEVESGEIEIEVNSRYVEYHTEYYTDTKVQDYLKEEQTI